MIPYDDLVTALGAWRARQGLPVAQAAGAPAAPPPRAPAPAPPPPAARKSAQQPAARTAPPSAPPRAAAPPPQAPSSVNDFDEGEGAMVEEAGYDGGDDFVVPFGGAGIETGESTAIGGAPEAPVDLLVPKRGKRNPDW